MALDKATIINKQMGFLAEILVNYEELEEIKYQLKIIEATIISIEYAEKVIILLEISKQNYEKNLLNYANRAKNMINPKILQEKFVDK